VALNKLTTGNNVGNAATYTSAPITPGADRVVVAFVASFAGGFGATAPQPVLTGNSLAWEQVETITMGNNSRRLTCFVARDAAPTAGPVTFTFTSQQDLCAWSIFEYDAAPGTATGVITQRPKDDAQNVATLSIAPSPDVGQYEVAVGGVLVEAPNQPSRVVTAGPGCNQIDIQAPTQQFAPSATLHTEERTTPGAVQWNWNGNADAAAIVLVVTVATAPIPPPPPPPVDPVENLIRTFEPILFFDNDERSFPSDAKRFVEHSALWQATSPFDDKKSWGASPRVAAGGLSASIGEPGAFLGTEANAPGVNPEELFLEFGGWLDKTGTAQPTVTATSAHPYANRDKIQDSYESDPALRDSQFWYHAELFDTNRLLHLAEGVEAPDLRATAASLRNAALLCYYLFFPERQQGVVGSNIEAVEVGSHAGQWACIALLFERTTPADAYTKPSFIGFTGSPTVPPTPQAVDDEFRTAMKVAEWRPAGGQSLPDVTDSHPHLWVSRGTHSLYLDDADHEVAPFPPGREPADAGVSDAPAPAVEGTSSAVGLIKAVIPFWGAVALALEHLFGAEYLWGSFGGPASKADPVPPDASPTTGGGGTTVHPAAVAPVGSWPNPKPWRSARNVQVGGRRYDFIVDRATQPLWPSDDGRQGFRGRWGQRVETDPFTRRAGVRFPEFWRMFLLALEDSRQ
jgi:hypothetical protein